MSARGNLRVIVEDSPADGAWNMGLDRALQLERAAGRSPATVRLYRWTPPTVSLGRFQTVEDVDVEACHVEGIDVVRRFTGGRGVLHDDELTYAVIASVEDGVPRGTTASYRYLCSALVEAYGCLGVDAGLTRRPRGERGSGACYLHATHADVSTGALKLSGSAQVWHQGVVLQHGSFVFARDIERERRVFRLSSTQAAALAETSATFEGLLPCPPEPEAVARAVCDAFEDLLGLAAAPSVPTAEELALAERLAGKTVIPAFAQRVSPTISLE